MRIEDIVATKFRLQIGTGDDTYSNTKEKLEREIQRAIRQYFFDSEFFYNWLGREEGSIYCNIFETETLQPMMKDINKTLKDYFTYSQTKDGNILKFNIDYWTEGVWRDKWFLTNKSIPKSILDKYIWYRKEYADVDLKK